MKKSTVFITGASSGIGLATVKYFLEKGWQVAATMRTPSALNNFNDNQSVKLYALDVTDTASINQIAVQAWNDFNGLDVVVNNAGYGAIGPLEGATEEQIRLQMDTNYMGTLRVMKAFIPLFRQQGKGVFVNISSIAGRLGMPLYNIYNASKFAIEGVTESLYYELRPFGIKVRLVEPGPIKTEFNGRSKVDITVPDDKKYEGFVKKIDQFYGPIFDQAETAETVAKTIYKAATNEGSTIRYPSGKMAKLLMIVQKITPGSWLRVITRKIINI